MGKKGAQDAWSFRVTHLFGSTDMFFLLSSSKEDSGYVRHLRIFPSYSVVFP